MKHYLIMCYKDRSDQAPVKRMIFHEDFLVGLSAILEDYAYVVVEHLDLVE